MIFNSTHFCHAWLAIDCSAFVFLNGNWGRNWRFKNVLSESGTGLVSAYDVDSRRCPTSFPTTFLEAGTAYWKKCMSLCWDIDISHSWFMSRSISLCTIHDPKYWKQPTVSFPSLFSLFYPYSSKRHLLPLCDIGFQPNFCYRKLHPSYSSLYSSFI